MGRAGITQDDVYNAANIVTLQNEIPTIKSVRLILGRGSSSTIHKYLSSWKMAKLTNQTNTQNINYLEFLLAENMQLKREVNALCSQLSALQSAAIQSSVSGGLTKIWQQFRLVFAK